MEECLQLVYIKIKGKPLSEYKNKKKNNNNLNEKVKNFVDDIFNQAITNKLIILLIYCLLI